MDIVFTLSLILAVVATVLAFIFIVPEKKRASLDKFCKFLHDTVNFKYLIVEKILQASYIFATIWIILTGFFMLFYVQSGYYGSSYWYGGYGLLYMILGPIVIRLVYEFLMMTILLIKNVIQINNKLKTDDDKKTDDNKKTDNVFKAPEIKNDEIPAARFCHNCGEKTEGGAFCTKCGTKL